MRVEQGARLGEYEIVSALGEGGMGAVYLARDHRLKRDVAIKFVTGLALEQATEQARVLQEARTAARLNHPNICTVHEVVTSEAGSFIVMERVEGRPLSAMIPSGGMPADVVARYGAQIAEALAHRTAGSKCSTSVSRPRCTNLAMTTRRSHRRRATVRPARWRTWRRKC
jgi:eukaryotic-like serine/threonine-protein kinase